MFKRAASRPCNIFMRLRADDGEPAVFKDDKDRFTACVPPRARHPVHVGRPAVPANRPSTPRPRERHTRARTHTHTHTHTHTPAVLTVTRVRRDINKTNTLKLRVDTDYLITLE